MIMARVRSQPASSEAVGTPGSVGTPRICHPGRVTTAYLAAHGYDSQLAEELAALGINVTQRHDRLFVTEDEPIDAAWSANTWFDAEYIGVPSIREAADALRERQRSWAAFAPQHRGRAELITAKLPHVSAKPLAMGAPAPSAPLGSWTLLTPGLMLAAARCSSPFPNGEVTFVEDREGPPSRAYLKLWEAFVRIGRWPQPAERCLDLGASPGGWTWTLASFGAYVTAVDKAPLAESVDALPEVRFRNASAFSIEPESFGNLDWLCSDVIAYPKRMFTLVERWHRAGNVRNMVVTVKFQGETDHEIAHAFSSIEGGRLFHLHHNRHELTFALLRD